MDKHHLADFPVSPGVTIIDTSVFPPQTYTYHDIERQINAVANGLLHLNLPPNSKIAIIGKNSYNYGTLLGGIARARHCSVPINFKIPQELIDFCFEDSGCMLAFCDSQYRHMVPAGIPVIEFDTIEYQQFLNFAEYTIPEFVGDYAISMMYTSGTTSKPKGVISTYAGRVWSLTRGNPQSNANIQLKGSMSMISVSPYYHLAGLNDLEFILYYSFWSSTKIVIMPAFNAPDYLHLAVEHQLTHMRMVAPMMGMLLQEKEILDTLDFSSVINISLTSSAAPLKMQEDVKEYFTNAQVENPYGLTETGPIFSQVHPYGIPKPSTSVGFPVPGIRIRLDENGVLQIKSPALMKGYNNRPDINSFTEDGYFITGDVFRTNKYGFYFYIGRNDDMFKSGGEKIYPSEIEETIDKHPAVAMSVVVGVPDDIKGFKPYAFVTLKPGHSASDIEVQQFTINRVATYQIPREVWIVDELPKTNIGKIDRRALTSLAMERLQTQP